MCMCVYVVCVEDMCVEGGGGQEKLKEYMFGVEKKSEELWR